MFTRGGVRLEALHIKQSPGTEYYAGEAVFATGSLPVFASMNLLTKIPIASYSTLSHCELNVTTESI